MTKEELKQEFEKYFEQKNNEGYLWVSQEMEQIELKDCCEMVCFDFAEPREKRIAELEEQNKWLEGCKSELGELLGEANNRVAELEKEKQDLEWQLQEVAKDNDLYQKENAELKADNEARKFAMTMSEKVEKQLREENAKLRDGIALKDEEIGCIETDFNTFKSEAKEIIKDITSSYGSTEVSEAQLYLKIKKAEQFLKNEGCPDVMCEDCKKECDLNEAEK